MCKTLTNVLEHFFSNLQCMTVIVFKLLHCATIKTILVPSFFLGSDFTENMLCSHPPPPPSLPVLVSSLLALTVVSLSVHPQHSLVFRVHENSSKWVLALLANVPRKKSREPGCLDEDDNDDDDDDDDVQSLCD